MIDRWLSRQDWLERPAEVVQGWVGAIYGALGGPGRVLKSLLHGTLVLRHPLHPAMTDLPLGAWAGALLLDLLAFNGYVPVRAADWVFVLGLVGAAAAAVTGYTDFHETFGLERRTAFLHGLLMTLAVVVMLAALVARFAGRAPMHPLATVLTALGLLIAAGGMYFGGHVVFGFGTMVNRETFLNPPEGWFNVGPAADFAAPGMKKVSVEGFDLLLVRFSDGLHAIANTCSHAGGPLDEGTLEGDTVVCPWHASRFHARDGAVRGGPAWNSQARFELRERAGNLEARLATPLH